MTPEQRIKTIYDATRFSITHLKEWIYDCKFEAKIYINDVPYTALGATELEAAENLEAFVSARIANPYGEYRI